MAKGDAKKIQGSNDTERLLFIGRNFNSLAEIPDSEVSFRSEDGEVVILKHGTKVTKEILERVFNEDAARTAAKEAALNSGVNLDDPKFIERVTAIATEAAMKVINAASTKK